MISQCCARTQSDIFKRCTKKNIKGSDFCKIHNNNKYTYNNNTVLYKIREPHRCIIRYVYIRV